MDYGFSINVSGSAVQQLKQIESEMGRLNDVSRNTGRDAAQALAPMEDKLKDIGRQLAELFAIREVFNFGKEILNVTAEFQGFENRVKFASMNTYDAGQNIAFLREEVEKLHIPMRQAYEGFSEMQAGLVGTGIEGERLRNLFEGIATAAATLHLPEYQLQRTLYDLKEIGEIGINMRIARSLSTALPGIGKLVKDTFGKSMIELEHEGISGGEFLSRLGPALKAHFEKGLENWGDSLQAKMADMKNAATTTMLQIGAQLEPTFKNIMSNIESAFNSEPVQFFIRHVSEVVSMITTAGGAFLVYKGILIATTIAERAFAVTTEFMGEMAYASAQGFTTLELAVAGFSNILESTGIGLFAVALTLAVQGMMNLNTEMDEWAEKVTGIKQSVNAYEEGNREFERVNTAFSGRGAMGGDEKQELYRDLQQQILADTRKLHSILEPIADKSTKADSTGAGPMPLGSGRGSRGAYYEWKEKTEKLHEAAKKSADNAEAMRHDLTKLQEMSNTLIKEGLKPLKGLSDIPPGSGTGLHGSHLSGAEGGLNQARIVNLKIDTVMKIEHASGPDLVHHATDAANQITRMMNNLSETKSGTF